MQVKGGGASGEGQRLTYRKSEFQVSPTRMNYWLDGSTNECLFEGSCIPCAH